MSATCRQKKPKKSKKTNWLQIGWAWGRSLPAPQGAWAAMPPSHWSLGPQGGGNGCTLVHPACVYTEEHDDCVLVTSDKPGHVTPLTAVWPFHNLSKLFLVHNLCWAAPCFRLSGGYWPSLPIILAFVFKGIPQPGNSTKIKLNCSFCSDHLSNPEGDRTRRHIVVSSSDQPLNSERSWRRTGKRSWGMGE